MSNLTFIMKNETYKIRFSHKTVVQSRLNMLQIELSDILEKARNKKNEIKQAQIELLTERQLIKYNNPINYNKPDLENDKRYIKRKELLAEYDDEHGRHIE